MYRFHWHRCEGQSLSRPEESGVFVHPRIETVEGWSERNVRTSFQARQQPCPYVEGRTQRLRTKVSVRENRCLCEQVGAAGLSRLNFAAEIGGLLTLAGPVDTVPAVPAVVGSRLSHAALPVSSSYDT